MPRRNKPWGALTTQSCRACASIAFPFALPWLATVPCRAPSIHQPPRLGGSRSRRPGATGCEAPVMALVLVSPSGSRGGQPCSTPFLLYPIVPGRVLVPAALPLVISIPSPCLVVPAPLALELPFPSFSPLARYKTLTPVPPSTVVSFQSSRYQSPRQSLQQLAGLSFTP